MSRPYPPPPRSLHVDGIFRIETDHRRADRGGYGRATITLPLPFAETGIAQ